MENLYLIRDNWCGDEDTVTLEVYEEYEREEPGRYTMLGRWE